MVEESQGRFLRKEIIELEQYNLADGTSQTLLAKGWKPVERRGGGGDDKGRINGIRRQKG